MYKVLAGGIVVTTVGGSVFTAYRYQQHSCAYKEEHVLFNNLLHRYKTGSIYTQLQIRGHMCAALTREPDILMDSHSAMIQTHAQQPKWVRVYQQLTLQSPPLKPACDLDDAWLNHAKQHLYKQQMPQMSLPLPMPPSPPAPCPSPPPAQSEIGTATIVLEINPWIQ